MATARTTDRPLAPLVQALAIAAATLAVACTVTQELAPDLRPSTNVALRRTLAARGVQVYECRAAPGGFAWSFVAPEAELYDLRGYRVGRHGAGPAWVIDDGSHVQALVKASQPAPHADSIPWLLLEASEAGTPGLLGGVTQIQRINTHGGKAPSDGCDATAAGRQMRVPYQADYRFYATTTTHIQ